MHTANRSFKPVLDFTGIATVPRYRHFSDIVDDLIWFDRQQAAAPPFCVCSLEPDPRACSGRRKRSSRRGARSRRRQRRRAVRGRSDDPDGASSPKHSRLNQTEGAMRSPIANARGREEHRHG
jgi:hypothetical protein